MKKQLLPVLAALGLFGSLSSPSHAAPKAALPLVVYGDGMTQASYIPSGYMGSTSAIKMDGKSTDHPHTGKTCLKVAYTAAGNWGGVDWQSPANDWGDKPGGFNLKGAQALTFWARGAKGGEVVSFLCGGVSKGKRYPDTAAGKLDKVTLTTAWKQYKISLKGQNLADIKTGFGWTVVGAGHPITFYLDDIQYR